MKKKVLKVLFALFSVSIIFATVTENSVLNTENSKLSDVLTADAETAVLDTEDSHVHLAASVNYACKGQGCTCDGFSGSFSGRWPQANACENCGHRRDWHTKIAKSGGSGGSSSPSKHEVHCVPCHGSGKCPKCNGKGWDYYNTRKGHGKETCPRCRGSGKCPYCNGTGRA